MFSFWKSKKHTAKKPQVIRNQARYKIVSAPDEWNREHGVTERTGEDEILSPYSRGRLLNLARNAARNSSTLNTLLTVLNQNVVGTEGGKVILPWDNSTDIIKGFSRFTQCADFFDGCAFNEVLKLILTTNLLGGNTVAVLDDGLVTDNGKLLVFEPDEIGDVPAEIVRRKYGQGATSSQGLVYDSYGRNIGVIVSRACRGAAEFDPDKCWYLRRDPDALPYEGDYFLFSNRFRPH